MGYLRKAATYLVQRSNGERLFVDEFETAVHLTHIGSGTMSKNQFLLRSGEQVTFVDQRTLQLNTGERLVIIDVQ
jgi:hypothetical protein